LRGFIKEYADGVFDPATITILIDAFDDAWRRAQASKKPYVSSVYASAGRRMIAKHIINAAQAGERDPRWLADGALLYLSQQKLSHTTANQRTVGGKLWSFEQMWRGAYWLNAHVSLSLPRSSLLSNFRRSQRNL
jgi:hypothetical protein